MSGKYKWKNDITSICNECNLNAICKYPSKRGKKIKYVKCLKGDKYFQSLSSRIIKESKKDTLTFNK